MKRRVEKFVVTNDEGLETDFCGFDLDLVLMVLVSVSR